jgi:hypothetical protein
MKVTPRNVFGLVLVAAALLGLDALSRAGYVADPADHALVRLAWRARGTRVRECRHRTAEELARLPVHMREDEVCEGRVLPFGLRVRLDEGAGDSAVIRPAGAREDRPVYVYRDLLVTPGSHRIRVEFARIGLGSDSLSEKEHLELPHPEHAEALAGPARVVLDTVVTLGEREIALVTYDADAQRLVVRGKTGP